MKHIVLLLSLSILGCTQYHDSHISHADFTGTLREAGWTAAEAEEDWAYYRENKSRY